MMPMRGSERRGFTLIELLISISILGVVTSFATANFRAGNRGEELRTASNLTIASIRRVQTMALAGQTQPLCAGGAMAGRLCLTRTDAECGAGSICALTVPRAYGIRYSTVPGENMTVTTFVDLEPSNKRYDAGEALRTEPIAPGAVIEAAAVTPTDAGALDIVFEPPKPRVWFNGSSSVAAATLQLQHSLSGLTKTLNINAVSGRIGE